MSAPATFTYGVSAFFDDPLFTGTSISDVVPSLWPVAINGRPYMLDTDPAIYFDRWTVETIPLLRQQADQSKSPAEQSLNPQGLWRRAQDSWHHGAGQTYRDRDDLADEYRFRSSKGIDCWTRYQLTLLYDTAQKKSSSNTNLYCVSAGARIYFTDNQTVYFTTSLSGTPTWTTVTGTPAASVTSIASDGFNVYIGFGASGIYKTDTSSSAAASFVTGTVSGPVAYTKGRLMAASSNSIYNPTGSGALPTALFSHGNTNFTWVGFAEGTGNIYAAGYSGDKSLIYRIAVKPDASTLDAPIVAGELPDGEIIRAISGYLGFVFLGTDKGVRFCEVDGQGNLTIGPVITTPNPVRCFEPQDRFMWFGWTNYDSTSTGLGRVDITQFVNTDQPAYASDVMVTGQGDVLSVATFGDKRVMTVSGLGVYAEGSTYVSSGTIDTGQMGFGIPDTKTGVYVDIRTSSLVGSYEVFFAADGGTFSSLGVESTATSSGNSFPVGGTQGERFEVRLTLTRGSTTTAPTILRWTTKVIPNSADGPAEVFSLPLMLYPTVKVRGIEYPVDVQTEYDAISSLRSTGSLVNFQVLNASYTGRVLDFQWTPYGLVDLPNGDLGMKGTLLTKIQRIS